MSSGVPTLWLLLLGMSRRPKPRVMVLVTGLVTGGLVISEGEHESFRCGAESRHWGGFLRSEGHHEPLGIRTDEWHHRGWGLLRLHGLDLGSLAGGGRGDCWVNRGAGRSGDGKNEPLRWRAAVGGGGGGIVLLVRRGQTDGLTSITSISTCRWETDWELEDGGASTGDCQGEETVCSVQGGTWTLVSQHFFFGGNWKKAKLRLKSHQKITPKNTSNHPQIPPYLPMVW